MAFVCCTKCGWGQDDFWSPDGYNPFRQDIVDDLKSQLFNNRCHFDTGFFDRYRNDIKPDGCDEKGPWIYGTNYVAWELRRKARCVENMHWKTVEEWNRDPGRWKCPKCKGPLTID